MKTKQCRTGLAWLLILFTALWFALLGYRHLVRPDEGRYAEIPREMLATHNWVTPRLDGYKYFEKPALQYWATAVAYEIFGQNEASARLWSALTGFIGILLLFFTGKKLYSFRTGLFSATILGSSLLYSAIGHINTLDMGVNFFLSLALCTFTLGQDLRSREIKDPGYMLLCWAAMAAAVLSKGLIGIVLPGAVLIIYMILERDFQLIKRLDFWRGLALFTLIATPWFIIVCLRNPEFFHFFFIYEHFDRYLTKDLHRYQPWYYFIPILIAGSLPWTGAMWSGLKSAWGSDNGLFKPSRVFFIWSIFIYVFFSLSDSKLPSYILPVYPALALLAGNALDKMTSKQFLHQLIPTALLGIVLLAISPFVPHFTHNPWLKPMYEAYTPWIVAASTFFLGGIVVAILLLRKERKTIAVLVIGFSCLLSAQLALWGYDALTPHASAWRAANAIKPWIKPGTPIYSVGTYPQTLPFYINHTVILVAFSDELKMGESIEPQKWIPKLSTFITKFQPGTNALAYMKPEMYTQLKTLGLKMKVLYQDPDRVIVSTPDTNQTMENKT
ncbi:MAG TPA: glycosyltransferase family 39 protein [Burkholderiales bacterium]|nr:glycosyltransferase family 39 protein [Burkholderiales bacterium]